MSATIADLAAWHARHHAEVRVVLHHLTALTPDHRSEVLAIQDDIHRILRDLVAAGAESGEFALAPADPTTTAIALFSLCVDTARWYHPTHHPTHHRTPDQIAADYATVALRIVGAPPQPETPPSPRA